RHPGRPPQRAEPHCRGCQRPLCPQPAELPDAAHRQGEQGAQDQLGGRDRQGHGADPRRPGGPSRLHRRKLAPMETTVQTRVEQVPFVFGLTVFALACFVGYYVVWRVTPALHSPLMAVTNAISSVIIVGALIAAGPAVFNFSQAMGFIAVALA